MFETVEKTGSEYISVKFVVQGGDHDGKVGYWRGFLTEAAARYTVEGLKACGCTFPGQDITNTEGLDTNVVRIKVEENEGGYLNVAMVRAQRGPRVKEGMNTSELKNRMRGLLADMGSEAPEPWDAGKEVDDADIPF